LRQVTHPSHTQKKRRNRTESKNICWFTSQKKNAERKRESNLQHENPVATSHHEHRI
jgi:hypothetical protein